MVHNTNTAHFTSYDQYIGNFNKQHHCDAGVTLHWRKCDRNTMEEKPYTGESVGQRGTCMERYTASGVTKQDNWESDSVCMVTKQYKGETLHSFSCNFSLNKFVVLYGENNNKYCYWQHMVVTQNLI